MNSLSALRRQIVATSQGPPPSLPCIQGGAESEWKERRGESSSSGQADETTWCNKDEQAICLITRVRRFWCGREATDLKQGARAIATAPICVQKDGSWMLYLGGWHGNQRHGTGVMVSSKRDCYAGTWMEGLPWGYGVHAFLPGCPSGAGTFLGTFNGRPDGKGAWERSGQPKVRAIGGWVPGRQTDNVGILARLASRS